MPIEPTHASVAPCWICGSMADSREHRIKKSDLVRRYGKQPFHRVGGVVHCVGETLLDVQGPMARSLTYDPLICLRCNNSTSQPWDRAYEQFERWLFQNARATLERRFILLEDVFGSDRYSDMCPALYKYFAKAFGCRLANAGEAVPQDVVELLHLDYFKTRLRLSFWVNKSIFLMRPEDRELYLGLGDLLRLDSESLGRRERYLWHMQVGWLRIWFFYDEEVPADLGAPWTSYCACLYLGEFEPITLEKAIELARASGSADRLAELETLRQSGAPRVE